MRRVNDPYPVAFRQVARDSLRRRFRVEIVWQK